jgi:hypothetical protein
MYCIEVAVQAAACHTCAHVHCCSAEQAVHRSGVYGNAARVQWQHARSRHPYGFLRIASRCVMY